MAPFRRTLIEVEYTPRTGKFRGQTVIHHYLGQRTQRVVWLKDVADKVGKTIFKRERLGTLWTHVDYNNVGREANTPFPDGKKPIELLKTCIQLYPQNEGLFLDAFAGSGSFGHAIWSQNAEDGGRRRFVLIQKKEAIGAAHPRHKRVVEWCAEHDVDSEISGLSGIDSNRPPRFWKAMTPWIHGLKNS